MGDGLWVRPYLEGIDRTLLRSGSTTISCTSGVGTPSRLACCGSACGIWHADIRADQPRRCASCPCTEGGDGRRPVAESTCWTPLTARPRTSPARPTVNRFEPRPVGTLMFTVRGAHAAAVTRWKPCVSRQCASLGRCPSKCKLPMLFRRPTFDRTYSRTASTCRSCCPSIQRA
jgi:hypothetical protein